MQTMNDLISRKALIAEYDRVHIGLPGGARKLMEDAPAVQQWISVKDRLPMMAEVGELVLVYTNENRHLIVTCWAVHKHKDQIIAWMPLPEPPKE